MSRVYALMPEVSRSLGNVVQRNAEPDLSPRPKANARPAAIGHCFGQIALTPDVPPITQRRAEPVPQQDAAPAPAPRDSGVPDSLQVGIERLSGVSLAGVRVHYNSPKPTQLAALAYTQGAEIHVAPGQEKYVPHEAWHVVQQRQGRVRATTQLKGAALNDEPALEREADVMGGRAASFIRDGGLGTGGSAETVQSTAAASSVVQRVPADFAAAEALRLNQGFALWGLTPWGTLKQTVGQYAALGNGATGAQREVYLARMENEATAWKDHHLVGANLRHRDGTALSEDEMAKAVAISELTVLIGMERREIASDPAVAKLGMFTDVGEGNMTAFNLINSGYRVPATHPQHVALNARITRWSTEGFDEVGQGAQNLAALNAIFGFQAPADAQRYSAQLRYAYGQLTRSVAPAVQTVGAAPLAPNALGVGQELAALLVNPGPYNVTLLDAGGHPHVKQVILKLILAPNIPGQFLSPFEQGMTMAQCIQSANPLPAVLMWDPLLHFEYLAPRNPADHNLAENAPARRGVRTTMDPWVVLAHELGHFKDFLTQPNEFANRLNQGDINAIEGWNLPREQAIVQSDLGLVPRRFYQDFPGGAHGNRLLLP